MLATFISCNNSNNKSNETSTSTKDSAVATIELYDSSANEAIDKNASIQVIGRGFKWVEGPVWVPAKQMLLFSDVPGLVYKKTENNEHNRNACCAAQMFLDSGDGMVFRGNIGPWYNPKTKDFHLSKNDAAELLNLSLKSFKEKSENDRYPDEVFIHAKTYFDSEEWEGFEEAAKGKSKIIGIRIRDDSNFKLYRDFDYCIPRGSALLVTNKFAYLWTKGFIPRIQTQLGLETPNLINL